MTFDTGRFLAPSESKDSNEVGVLAALPNNAKSNKLAKDAFIVSDSLE